MREELKGILDNFVKTLNANEKSKNTIEKYERDVRDFLLWVKENRNCDTNIVDEANKEVIILGSLNNSNVNSSYILNKKEKTVNKKELFFMSNEKVNKKHLLNNKVKEIMDIADLIEKEDLIRYKELLKIKYSEISTINSKISSINAFLSFENKNNLKIKFIKTQKTFFKNKENILTKSDLQKLLDISLKKKNKRLYYSMLLIARTGLRVSEVEYVTVNSIKEGQVVVNNKGKVRVVIIPRKLCKLLLDYCKNQNIKEGKIFITKNGNPLDRKNIWREMKDLCKLVDVDTRKVFPHNLRHLFAREFYQQTKDIVLLASILGHSSIETTRIYTKNDLNEYIEMIEMIDERWGKAT